MKLIIVLLLLWNVCFCGNIVTINNWDDIIVIGGNITENILTPTSSEILRALTIVDPKVKIAMAQTYGGLNAQYAWNWLLTQYPPFQTPLNYESGLFYLNGSSAEQINIALWQFAMVITNYVQPGCASGSVPLWTEQNDVKCSQLLDVDVHSTTASNIIYFVIISALVAIAFGILYFVGGNFYKATPRKIKDN